MTEVKLRAWTLTQVWSDLNALAKNQMPTGLRRAVRKQKAAVEEYHAPFLDNIRPIIVELTGEPSIDSTHERYGEFLKLADAYLNEELAIEVQAIPLDELDAVPTIMWSEAAERRLLEAGFLTNGNEDP